MNKLAELRRRMKLSQREVAEALNISQSALSQYERGGRSIDDAMLKKLCAYFDVSADELLGLQMSPLPQKSLPEDANELLKLFSRMNDKFKIRLIGAAYAMLAEQKVNSNLDLDKMRKAIK